MSLRTGWIVGLGVLMASSAGFAQPSAAAVAAGQGVAVQQPTTTGITRQSNENVNLGEFPAEGSTPTPQPRPVRPTGNTPVDVGGTGQVAEHNPTSALRGNTGPAPGEIDMTTPIGPGDVARILRSQDFRFRPCYERALATHRNLAGRVVLSFTITRTGQLDRPSATGMPEAPEVATCMQDQLRLTRFPPPSTGTLPFVYPMNLAPPVAPAHGRQRPAAHPARPGH